MSFVGLQGLRGMRHSHEKDTNVSTSTPNPAGTPDPWPLVHAERARLADALAELTPDQWRAPSACAGWTVEDVVAHLSAVASTGTVAWIVSIVRARFDADRHNARLLAKQRGTTPAETRETFRRSIASTIAPAKAYTALLGETVVHGQDIARPLGITLEPAPEAVAKVARFYARKDFAVNSKTLVAGLTLRADDVPFEAGTGPLVHGPVLDLVLTMAGRPDAAATLAGDGADELRSRLV